MIYGTRRLWCDETINEVLGIDDRFVAIRGHASMFVYDRATGEQVTGVDPRSITSGDLPLHPAIAIQDYARSRWSKVSADGKWAALGTLGSRTRVYDNTTGELQFADDPQHGFGALAFSHDGTRIAALAGGAYVFGGDARRHVAAITHGLAFDAAGDLIGGARGKLARWSIDGEERTRVSVRHKIESLSIGREGRYAATCTVVTGGLCMAAMPDVVVADLARGVAILRFHDGDDVSRSVALSPDARWLAIADFEGTRLMPAAPRAPWSTPPVVARWPGHALVLGEDRALLIDEQRAVRVIALPTGAAAGGTATALGELAWSPDGAVVEIAPDRQHVRWRDPATLEVTCEHATDTAIEDIAISHDGARLAITDGPTIEIVPRPTPRS